MYVVVLEIRGMLANSPDTRFGYFQTPLCVEDALGVKFHVDASFDYATLVVIIQHRFKEGTGALDVRTGNYELCRTNKRSELITADTRLMPGMAITMAIIIMTKTARDSSCPRPGCGSSNISRCLGGAWVW
jgi:hypothetical protein